MWSRVEWSGVYLGGVECYGGVEWRRSCRPPAPPITPTTPVERTGLATERMFALMPDTLTTRWQVKGILKKCKLSVPNVISTQ